MPSIASRTGLPGHTTDVATAAPAAGGGTGAPAATYTAVPVVAPLRGNLASGDMLPGAAQSAFTQQTNVGYPRSFLRPVVPVSPVAQRVTLKTTPQTTETVLAAPGQPFPLVGTSASSEPFKTATGEVKCLVSVSYTSSPPTGARIWFVGYHGSTTPALVSEGTESPVTFLADPTGETVTVYSESAQAGVIGKGPLLTWAPKTTVVLNPATAAPPAPGMAQDLVGTPTGYQFEFNQIAGLAANVIDGYAVYRNTTDSQTSATQIAYLKQNPKAAAPVLFTDIAAQGQSYFYFIASVDTSGNESALTSAQTGAIVPLSAFTATGQLWGPAGISGTSAAAMSLAQVHDVAAVSQGAVLLQNPNFVAGNVGWAPQAGWAIVYAGAGGFNGSQYFAQYTGLSTAAISNNQMIPCSAGAVISATAYTEGSSTATGNAIVRVAYYDGSGAQIDAPNGSAVTAGIGWVQSRCVATAPAGTAYAVIDFAVYAETSGFWNIGGFTASILANSLDEVPNGSTYGRTNLSYVDLSGNVTNADGLGGVAASGITPIEGLITRGSSSSFNKQGGLTGYGNLKFTYTGTSSTVTVSWAQFGLYRSDGSIEQIAAGSYEFTGLAASTTYDIGAGLNIASAALVNWIAGATALGAASTFSSQEVVTVLGLDGNIALLTGGPGMQATTAASGGTTTGGGNSPTASCPALDMFVRPFVQVGDLEIGDVLDCTDGPSPVLGKEVSLQPCVRLWTDFGHELIVSVSTPFELEDGSTRRAIAMDRQTVLADTGEGSVRAWVTCHAVPCSPRLVSNIFAGDRTFASGSSAALRIYSHNFFLK